MIGSDFFGEGISAKSFSDELRKVARGAREIDLHINSDGGVVTEARSMYSQLVALHDKTINVYVDGVAASAASFLAMAGDRIIISEGAFFMIHDARMIARGTASDFRKRADELEMVSETMVDTYAARTGQSKDKIRKMMAAETWMTGREAVDLGFADELSANKAKALAYDDCLGMYEHVPVELRPNRSQARATLERLQDGKM